MQDYKKMFAFIIGFPNLPQNIVSVINEKFI